MLWTQSARGAGVEFLAGGGRVAESLNKGGEWEALATDNSLGLTYYPEMTAMQ